MVQSNGFVSLRPPRSEKGLARFPRAVMVKNKFESTGTSANDTVLRAVLYTGPSQRIRYAEFILNYT
jgi:hypothetical protein